MNDTKNRPPWTPEVIQGEGKARQLATGTATYAMWSGPVSSDAPRLTKERLVELIFRAAWQFDGGLRGHVIDGGREEEDEPA